jgi:transporter family-2 protein
VDRVIAFIGTLIAGALVAAQPPANALLARHVGALGTAFTSLLCSTTIVGGLLVATGSPGMLQHLSSFRWEYLIGGVPGAAIVSVSLVAVRQLGAAGVTAALVTTQLIVALRLDRLGALGLERAPLTATRLGGLVLLVAGTALISTR